MPIYDFRCGTCRTEFETLCRDGQSDGVACPQCGGRSVARLISRFAVSRQLSPCGTPASDAAPGCGFNAQAGGCMRCDR